MHEGTSQSATRTTENAARRVRLRQSLEELIQRLDELDDDAIAHTKVSVAVHAAAVGLSKPSTVRALRVMRCHGVGQHHTTAWASGAIDLIETTVFFDPRHFPGESRTVDVVVPSEQAVLEAIGGAA